MAKKSSAASSTSSPSLKAGPAQAPEASSYSSSARTTSGATPRSAKPAATPMQAGAIALPRLSHEQIARRARAIWEKKGHPVGQDEQNWYQAEAELRTELHA